jgi:hypothetical protein
MLMVSKQVIVDNIIVWLTKGCKLNFLLSYMCDMTQSEVVWIYLGMDITTMVLNVFLVQL